MARKLAGFALGALGGAFFLWSSLRAGGQRDIWMGISLSLLAMLAWAAYTVAVHYLEGADRAAVLGVQHGVSTLLIAPLLGLYLLSSPLIFVPDLWSALGVLFAGGVSSGFAYLFYFQAIESLGAPRASSFLFLVPFVSLLGDLFLGELPPPLALIGGAAALVGVALIKTTGSET